MRLYKISDFNHILLILAFFKGYPGYICIIKNKIDGIMWWFVYYIMLCSPIVIILNLSFIFLYTRNQNLCCSAYFYMVFKSNVWPGCLFHQTKKGVCLQAGIVACNGDLCIER
jgi:hypothetical protein